MKSVLKFLFRTINSIFCNLFCLSIFFWGKKLEGKEKLLRNPRDFSTDLSQKPQKFPNFSCAHGLDFMQ